MPPSRTPLARAAEAARLDNMFALAQALHQQGRIRDAERIYNEILRLNTRHADAMHFLGLIAVQAGELARGVTLIEKALALKPRYPEALTNLAIAYTDLKRPLDALAACDRALALRPDLAEVHDTRGNALRALGRYAEAVAAFDKAITLRPDDAGAHSNRGNALRDMKQYDEALLSYDRAITLLPGFAEARCNRAIVLHAMGRYQEALTELQGVIALAPDHAEAHYNHANVLIDLKRPEDALTSLARALALKPDYPDAWNSRGNALQSMRQNEAALASYARALVLSPGYAAAHHNMGNALAAMQREVEALIHFDQAITAQPDNADSYHARALVLAALKRYPEALTDYERALALAPDRHWLLGETFAVKRHICDWTNDGALLEKLTQWAEQGHQVSAPQMVGILNAPALLKKAAERFTASAYPPDDRLPPITVHSGGPRIRVGYFSADFHDHATMHLASGLFGCHDRSRFDLTAFSFGPDQQDPWRERAIRAFDCFIDVRAKTDREVALLARSRQIDIAVDLKGHTQGCRTGIFALRAAPVQASFIGFPGTMGASYMDYIVADRMLIPPGAEQHYTEKAVLLPDTYQPNDCQRVISGRRFTRRDEGLPEDGFVFCCFNNNYKITPRMFDIWMRILGQVKDSVLWLYEENPFAAANLRKAAADRSISPDRLIFAARLPSAEHLARHCLADLLLDTVPCNAHTTASDALWAGVPVLTLMGDSFAGRVGASLLHAIGLDELITQSESAYETLAIALAADLGRLRTVRDKLRANRLTAPLFDTVRFVRHLEAAFEMMHARAQAGLPPDHIEVDRM